MIQINKVLSRTIKKNGAEIKTILTNSAKKFVTPLSVASLSQGKVYKPGVQVTALIDAEDQTTTTDEFGPDAQQDSQFHILRQTLLDLSLTPEIGDIVEWNYGFFEVNGILENQLIGGMQENNWSVTLNTHLSRQSFTNQSRIRSI